MPSPSRTFPLELGARFRMERAAWRQVPVQGCRIFLILLFLVDPGFLANAMTTAQDYIEQKQMQVSDIAVKALSNADNCAYQLEHCNEQCSRAACFQTSSDVAVASCVGVTINSNCTCKTQARADYTRSYVRIPGLDDENTILNYEIKAAICTQRSLDDLFLSRTKNYIYAADNIYYSFFFGNVEGAFRFFPGTSIQDCKGFDPRVRPWYIGAISVVKDLVVLVDMASSMANSIGSNGATALGMAINMTTQLLDTLTQSDRVTVTAYNINWVSTYSYTVPAADGTTLNLTSDSQFMELRRNVSMLGSAGATDPSITTAPSNTTAAIRRALQVLGNAGSPTGALKVIVVLTNGQSPVPPDQPGLDDLVRLLNTSYISLFVYQIDGNDDGLAGLASNLSLGRNEQVPVDNSTVLNPLYTLKSYFSLLANARNSSGNGSFFWQPPYQDYNFLGLVRTVAYPAISSTGELVGVAGIVIQVSKIDQNIAPEIEGILNTEKVTRPPTISPAQLMTIAAIGNPSESTSCNASTFGTRAIVAVCQQNAIDMLVQYPDGLCCSLSGCKHKHHVILTGLWGLGIGVLVTAIGILGGWACWKKRGGWACWKKRRTEVQSHLQNPSGGYL